MLPCLTKTLGIQYFKNYMIQYFKNYLILTVLLTSLS